MSFSGQFKPNSIKKSLMILTLTLFLSPLVFDSDDLNRRQEIHSNSNTDAITTPLPSGFPLVFENDNLQFTLGEKGQN